MEVLPDYEFDYVLANNISGYVNLPQKVLDDLKDANFPLLFRLSTNIGGIIENEIFCGVKEFIENKNMSIPRWMMENLMSPENGKIKVEYIKYIPPGKYIELQPLEEELFNVLDYDKYLENVLSDHCILTRGQIFKINVEGINFNIKVNEVEIDWEKTDLTKLTDKFSDKNINVVNCDINVNIVNNFLIEHDPIIPEHKKESKPEHKKESKPEHKKESNPEHKKESNPEHKKESNPEHKKESKPEHKKESNPDGEILSRDKLREHYIKFYSKK